jgi:hypothetical protein
MINMSYNTEITDIIHQTFLLLNQVQIYKNSAQPLNPPRGTFKLLFFKPPLGGLGVKTQIDVVGGVKKQ